MSEASLIRDIVLTTLSDNKAKDILELPVNELTDITDIMIVASGTSNRHLDALCDHVWTNAKLAGHTPLSRTGDPDSGWILIDFSHVIVHIMHPTVRQYYQIESLWSVRPEEIVEGE